MNTNIAKNYGDVQISLAPWIKSYMEQTGVGFAFSNNENRHMERLDRNFAEQNTELPMDRVMPPIMDMEYQPENHKRQNPTDPIYSLEDIERFKKYFLGRKGHKNNNIRDYAYFVFSLNVSRRAGDILALHVYDILNADGTFKTHVIFDHEQKTGKKATVLINSKAREALAMYFTAWDNYKMSDWLFPKSNNKAEAQTVDGMRRMLQRAAKALGIEMHMGTHSLRKTNPYHIISQSVDTEDEVMVSQFLNHGNIKTTYHYIKRSQNEMDQFVEAHAM